ncbi:hypothetical protein [Rhizobium sp. CCGE531]|uniref:hypothetical protein n=1 Tax=Rhizobium sp. CCGE531 TaxID=2364271 RepID=UPI000EAA1D53|nr:hypothetical protein [Rhizobium sp. CCGE531]AYG66125.1 hypothetical protein CCGE531_09085 [Rhizobium sp. CCGE531]
MGAQEMIDWPDWISAAGGLLGGLGTAGGVIYAARQIQLGRHEQQRDEQWRRTEFARGLIDRLSSDDELVFCTRALEWGVGPLIIPEKYRILFTPPCSTFEHSQSNMSAALKADLGASWRTPEALTYRYCFDTFFSYLEVISHHLKVENVQRAQLVGLDYYLRLVREPPYLDWSRTHPFLPFLDRYYPGLRSFIWHCVEMETGS